MARESELKMPVSLTSPVEVGRLVRELTQIDEALLQLGLRKGGSEPKLPKTSSQLDKAAELNKYNLLKADHRKHLLEQLSTLRTSAPVLHVSFSADPSAVFLEKFVTWLRQEIDPHVLVTIGLQPALGAGCIVRTNNKQFDLSLRKDFERQRSLLADQLQGVQPAKAVV